MLPIIGLFGCSRDTVRVTGEVVRVRGNQMPSPDVPPPVHPGFKTTLFFFEPFKADRTSRTSEPGTYREVRSPLKAKVSTDEKGAFSLRLPAGRYSVLIGRDSLFYTNILDGEGYLNPVEFKRGAPNILKLRADWDAVY
jgi:hypothetical protein